MKKIIALVMLTAFCACSGGGGGSSGDDNAASLSGVLQVSNIGQPQVIEIDEVEPADDSAYWQSLGPLTPGLTYLVHGAISHASDGDEIDLYTITEPAAQVVTVTLTHDPGSDFDIIAYDIDSEGTITEIGSSTRTESPDQFTYTTPAPVPGESYLTAIAVSWYAGGGDYELRIEADFPNGSTAAAVDGAERTLLTTAGNDHPVPSLETVWDVSGLDAVPGQVLVKWQAPPQENTENRSLSANQSEDAYSGSMVTCGEVTGIATVLCEDDQGGLASRSMGSDDQGDREALLRKTIGRVLRLRADPAVELAIPNYIYHPFVTPNDEHYSLQWHYPMIGLPEAWDTTTGSSDVIVAVLDTGIVEHPDLAGRVIAGYDFISDPDTALDGDGRDNDPTDEGDGGPNGGSSWHGTHVAGTIGAATNNGTGVAGVDWNCKIMPVRVLGRGGGSSSDIMNAILYAAGLSNSSGTLPARRADVINMSLGGADPSGDGARLYQDTIAQARQAGVLVVAAAGNDATSVPATPANVPGVMSVSAVDLSGELAPYSNFGTTIDIAAPGGNTGADLNGDNYADGVLSTLVNNDNNNYTYHFYQGTSMAAPHVAGVAALCLAANPDLSVDQLEELIQSTATDIGDPGRDNRYGHGLINVAAAVQQASGVDPNPDLEIFPNILNFGADETSLDISIVNTGTDTLELDPPTVSTHDGGAWLSAALATGSELGAVVTVDRTGMANGRYAGRVTLSSNNGSKVVEVNMEVTSGQAPADIGTVFILLLNPETWQAVAQADTTQSDSFSYQLSGVDAGSYVLVAGTDKDDDDTICESNDFCGAYPLLGEPTIVNVAEGGTLADLNFPLTYVGEGLDSSLVGGDGATQWEVILSNGVRRLR